jgi:type I restriction enzyme S subunit
VNKGDIIMSIRATVGTVALLPDSLDGANLTQGTARISPSKIIEKSYLFYYLQTSDVQSWINKQVKGATFREITLKKLRELPVLLPPQDLQIMFSIISEKINTQKIAFEESKQHIENLYQSLVYESFNRQTKQYAN